MAVAHGAAVCAPASSKALWFPPTAKMGG
jgi:hypothetical protein